MNLFWLPIDQLFNFVVFEETIISSIQRTVKVLILNTSLYIIILSFLATEKTKNHCIQYYFINPVSFENIDSYVRSFITSNYPIAF